MGSGKYTVALGMMAKPGGDGGDDGDVAYLVDFMDGGGDGDAVSARVRRRGPLGQSGDVEVELSVFLVPDALLIQADLINYHVGRPEMQQKKK
jgi:hypothetical protein